MTKETISIADTNAIRSLIQDRIEELDQEKRELEQALSALNGTPKTGSGRRSGFRQRRTTKPRKPAGRRRRKGGTRADHALKLLTDQPGLTAAELAESLKIKPNYMYRVLAGMVEDGLIRKDKKQYFPAEDEAE